MERLENTIIFHVGVSLKCELQLMRRREPAVQNGVSIVMAITHSLGYPRIGRKREHKFLLEKYWAGECSQKVLEEGGRSLRKTHWGDQANMNMVPVGDFSWYDQVLDTSALFGCLPRRVLAASQNEEDQYFLAARGKAANGRAVGPVKAARLTKWFNTNYHYLVPELELGQKFELQSERLLGQAREAIALGHQIKPTILGPVTFVYLAEMVALPDGVDEDKGKIDLLQRLLPEYEKLLSQFVELGVEWVQFDEPILSLQLSNLWQTTLNEIYHRLKTSSIKILLANYYGALAGNLKTACELPVDGLHIDSTASIEEVGRVVDWLPGHKVLSVGVVDGRNIWKSDLNALLDWLEPVYQRLGKRLWLAPSCSLLHVPLDIRQETALAKPMVDWLAFAVQKLEELVTVSRALREGRESVADELTRNRAAIQSRKHHEQSDNSHVRAAISTLQQLRTTRKSAHDIRASQQQSALALPLFPTTTIGSFPQTEGIRAARLALKAGAMRPPEYEHRMKKEIANCLQQQEAIGLDVLVHGEAERNDMVEYFGQHLQGFIFTDHGWVQSYGSRCVKPPIIYGDVKWQEPITVKWTGYAQSLTSRPVKGMLTGPVTILNWSFVRDDQPRELTCKQIALAMREEVLALERAGVKIIQVDEAALREGLPLHRSKQDEYLEWAVESFAITVSGVADSTQIHTHMCYSDFNGILNHIARMDADVITIEMARSDKTLLKAFRTFVYPNGIGPGVYDIHSPTVPTEREILDLLKETLGVVQPENLWVNPDCGLKTRKWEEVIPALQAMVAAARKLRKEYADSSSASRISHGNASVDLRVGSPS